MGLARAGVLMVKGNGVLHGVADQIVLEVVLVIPRNDLLVDRLGEISLVLLLSAQVFLLLRVGVLKGEDALVLDEL
jgi:hypothetical protein